MIDLTHLIGTRLPRWTARYYPDLLWRVPTTSRMVYLTFDDGPTTELTHHVLDRLALYDARASFFLLGRHARRHPDLVKAIDEAGHTIGNHSYSHLDAWRSASSQVLADLERSTGLLEDQLGRPLRWMRPPFGRFTRAVRQWCQIRRQRCTMWDLGPGDFLASASVSSVERRILHAVRPGSIIVLHDNPKALGVLPAALDRVLHNLSADGWTFSAL